MKKKNAKIEKDVDRSSINSKYPKPKHNIFEEYVPHKSIFIPHLPNDKIQDKLSIFNTKHKALKFTKISQSAEYLFKKGNELAARGHIDEAIEAYQGALSIKSEYAEAHLNMGIALKSQGKFDEAIWAYQRALAARPSYVEAFNNIGVALKNQGKFEESLIAYRSALLIRPDYVDAIFNVGNVLALQGHTEEAIITFRKALAIEPRHVKSYCKIGDLLATKGQISEAIETYRQALAIKPNHAAAHINIGVAHAVQGNFNEAIKAYQIAISIKPNLFNAYYNLGNALANLGNFDEAIKSYRHALAINPNFAEAENSLGYAFHRQGRLQEAIAALQRALTVRPNYAEACNNLGIIFKDKGNIEDSIKYHDRAISIKNDHAEFYFNKSLALILNGNYNYGWRLYEYRLKIDGKQGNYYNFADKINWRGEVNKSIKKLFVYHEQGLGDFIQFCRYLPLLSNLGYDLIVEAPIAIKNFVCSLNCDFEFITKGDKLPEFDAYCPIMSLPNVFKTNLKTIPSNIPYLKSDPKKVQIWQERLGEKLRPRIGLAWSGFEGHKNDHNRSIEFEIISLLLDEESIDWHSLQIEYRISDRNILDKDNKIIQHQDLLADFSDTAALIECMDLVITVDTSVAHATGALGKSLWLLLPYAPDYRWKLNRQDSPWYPSAKIYRQNKIGDWIGVINKLKNDIRIWNKAYKEKVLKKIHSY